MTMAALIERSETKRSQRQRSELSTAFVLRRRTDHRSTEPHDDGVDRGSSSVLVVAVAVAVAVAAVANIYRTRNLQQRAR